MNKFKDYLTTMNEANPMTKKIEDELNQVMQIIAGDAMGAGISVADSAIDNFETYAGGSNEMFKEWNSMSYTQKLKLAKKLAKQY